MVKGMRHTKESRNKMSKSHKGISWSEARRKSQRRIYLIKKCVTCGGVFIKVRCEARKKSFCSKECRYEFLSRKLSGRKLSVSHKKSISEARKGWAYSDETRSLLSKAHKGIKKLSGPDHPNWVSDRSKLKGRPRYELREWSKAVFERDNYTCQICGKRGGKLQADHIKAYALYPELRFELSNGRTLCIPCHKETPNYGIGLVHQMRKADIPVMEMGSGVY